MALDFPNAPSNGQQFTPPGGGGVWFWDGAKWAGGGGGGAYLPLTGGTLTGLLTLPGPPTVPLHAATKGYVDGYLPLTGGTLTGLLTLSGPPTAALHAATKAYVDGRDALYLPLAGGVVSGAMHATAGIAYPGVTNGTHLMSFAWDGRIQCYVDAIYVGAMTFGGPFLPLTGGILSGRVTLSPSYNGGADLVLQASNGNYLQQFHDGSNASIFVNSGNLRLTASVNVIVGYSTASKGLIVQSIGGSYLVFTDDGNSHISSTTQIWVDVFTTFQGNVVVNGETSLNLPLRIRSGSSVVWYDQTNGNLAYQIYARDGYFRLWVGGYGDVIQINYTSGYVTLNGTNLNVGGGLLQLGTRVTLGNDGAYTVLYDAAGRANIHLGGGDATNYYRHTTHQFQSAGGVYQYFTIGYGGSTCTGSLTASGNLTANGGVVYLNGMYWQNNGGFMYTPWAIRTDNYIRVNGIDVSNNSGYLYAAGLWSASDTVTPGVYRRSLVGSAAKGGRLEMWAGSDWDNVAFAMGAGNFLFSPDLGASGFYVTPTPFSDARLKADIRDTEIDALSAILATPVRAFRWNEEGIRLQPHLADPQVPIGFVAQEVEETIPSAVEASPFKDGNLHIRNDNLTPYLVRAIQQLEALVKDLTARLATLEGA